jgi:hypothetical protein
MLTATFKWSEQRLQRGTNNQWTATWAWEVTGPVNELQDDTLCTTAPGINQVGYQHPSNPYMAIQTLTADPGIALRKVTAQFAIGTGTDQALNEPPTFNPQPAMISAPVDDDFDGNPLVNAAGFPITGLTDDFPALQIDVSLNMPFFDTAGALAAMYCTNTGPKTVPAIGSIDTGQGYIKSIRPAQPFKLGAQYVRVLYSIFAQKDGWKKRVPNKGTRGWYTGADGNNYSGPFCDIKGKVITEPVLLDNAGLPLDVHGVRVLAGSAVCNPVSYTGYIPSDIDSSNANITFINFKLKGTYDFGSLPF